MGDKTNEIPVVREIPPRPPLRGCVVTADALHIQTATARRVLDGGADDLLVVIDNHPGLHTALEASCADPRATLRSATTDRAHGRTETRTLSASTRLCGSTALRACVTTRARLDCGAWRSCS